MGNIIKINDWEIKRFLRLVLGIQLAVLGLVALNAVGYGIPVLTQGVGFIYLSFIPGVIILRILKLHKLSAVKVLLYSVGLSIAFLMLTGFLMNLVYPHIGISRPISTLPLIITITVALGILCTVAYIRDRGFSAPARISWSEVLSPPFLFLLLLPLLAILGAQLVNLYQSNALLMILMVLLSLIPIVLVFTGYIPERLYPLAVGMAALSLLLHRSLISSYLWGADIIGEYSAYRMVEMNSIWNAASANLIPAYNVTLSVTILPAIFSNLLAIEGIWVFKAIFPLFLSLVPLAMYEMLRVQFSKKVAFLSSFLFMSLYLFYTTFLGVGKQLIATLFLALFVVVMTDRGIGSRWKTALLSVFGVGLIVSHYSTAFLLMIIVPAALVLLYVLRRKSSALTVSLAVVLVAVTFCWYMLNANGAVIRQFVGMGESALSLGAISPALAAGSTGAGVEAHRLMTQGSINLPDSLRYFYLATQFLIVAGVISIVWRWLKRREKTLSDEYMAFSFLFLGILGLELLLPKFSLVISLDRIYPVCLFFLAPFCIIGAEALLKSAATGLSPASWKALLKGGVRRALAPITVTTGYKENGYVLRGLAVFFAIFLLLNTGFVYELIGQPLSSSIALSRGKVDFPIYDSREFAGAEWLVDNGSAARHDFIYYDSTTYHLFAYLDAFSEEITGETAGQMLYRPRYSTSQVATEMPANSYMYLRSFNIEEQRIALGWPAYQTMDALQVRLDSLGLFSTTIIESNMIYSNGGSQVLYTLEPYSPR